MARRGRGAGDGWHEGVRGLARGEATNDVLQYTYDVTGRLIAETRAGYTDNDGQSVQPVLQYFYDALGDLTRTVQTARAGVQRVTKYSYGADGRVSTMTDAGGKAMSYYYDIAGNLVRQSYVREKADGQSGVEGILFDRDLLGRVVVQRRFGRAPRDRAAGRLARVYDTDRSQRRVDYGWLDTGLLSRWATGGARR